MPTFLEWLEAMGLKMDGLAPTAVETLQASYDAEKTVFEAANKPAPKEPKEPTEPKKPLQATGATAADEKARTAGIHLSCAGEFSDIEAKAIADDWSIAETDAAVLKAFRAKAPQAPAPGQGASQADDDQVLEAAILLRSGYDDTELAKDYGDKVMSAAYKERGISLPEICMSVLRASGQHIGRSFSESHVQAAFSTVSLPGILGNVLNKAMLKSFNLQPNTAPTVCSTGDLNDFKQSSRFRLNDIGGFDKVGPSGELASGTLGEESATNQLDTYGKILFLTRQMVIDDDLNSFVRIPEGLGARASQNIDILFYERLLSNPDFPASDALFSTENENFISGANTALDVDALDLANRLFMNQKDQDGQFIGVMPRFLLVPTSLKFAASQLVNSVILSQGGTDATNLGTSNPVQSMGLQIVVSPHLENPATSGFSTKAWYLFGDPRIVDTFEIGFLKGQRTPTLERVNPGPEQLGLGWRIYHDVGIREQEFRGMVKSKGEA